MHLLNAEILKEASGVSPLVGGVGLAVGAFLWLWGGRTHRFWMAAVITAAAGLLGLNLGPASGMQPLVAGLLLGVAAGALALSLMRLLLFMGGGLAGWGLAHVIAPGWGEPLLCFVVGGLVGVLLHKFWMTALSALAGTLLMGYAGLCLGERFAHFDAAAWVGRNAPLLDWACASFAVLGVLAQFLLERRRRRRQTEPRPNPPASAPAPPPPPPPPPPAPPPTPWWQWRPPFLRKAG